MWVGILVVEFQERSIASYASIKLMDPLIIPFRKAFLLRFGLFSLAMIIIGAYIIITKKYDGGRFDIIHLTGHPAQIYGLLILIAGLFIFSHVLARLFTNKPALMLDGETIQLCSMLSHKVITLRREDITSVDAIESQGIWPLKYRFFRIHTTKPDTPFRSNSPMVIDRFIDEKIGRVREAVIVFEQGTDKS